MPTADVQWFRFSLERIVRKYRKLTDVPMDFGTGERLYPAEIHAVEAVGTGKGDTVTALSSCFAITKGAVSQMVSKLERRGYVTRVSTGQGAKRKPIALTTKGKTALKGHAALHRKMEDGLGKALSGVTPRDVERYAGFLDLLEAQIDGWTASLGQRSSAKPKKGRSVNDHTMRNLMREGYRHGLH